MLSVRVIRVIRGLIEALPLWENQRCFNGSATRRSPAAAVRRQQCFNASSISRGESKFLHNLGPVSVLYIGERPEMTTQERGIKQGHNNENEINQRKKDET